MYIYILYMLYLHSFKSRPIISHPFPRRNRFNSGDINSILFSVSEGVSNYILDVSNIYIFQDELRVSDIAMTDGEHE